MSFIRALFEKFIKRTRFIVSFFLATLARDCTQHENNRTLLASRLFLRLKKTLTTSGAKEQHHKTKRQAEPTPCHRAMFIVHGLVLDLVRTI